MYIVYHDVGGTHSAVVAAGIHLNKLPMDRIPDKSEILGLSLFDRLEKHQRGHLVFHGLDEYGHEVYTLSRQYAPEVVTNGIKSVFDIMHMDKNLLICADTSPSVNGLMRIGGGSSRRFGMVSFGRPIVTYGTLKAYPRIIEIVQGVKRKTAP
ncbi:MAG: DUF3189 family protein [Bacillota bacterium]